MNSETYKIIIIALSVILVAAIIFITLRSRLKKFSAKGYGLSAKVTTRDAAHLDIKDIEQSSDQSDNSIKIRSTNAKVSGISQKAKKSNSLEIGN